MQVVDEFWSKLPWNQIPDHPRVIHINRGPQYVNDNADNHVSTTKYNILTFLPKNLLVQFTRLANILFLLIACLQLFTGLSPTGRYGYAVSLAPMILVQMIKDAVEDILRAWTDRKVNYQKTLVLNRDGTSPDFTPAPWYSLHVGEIIKISDDELIPADVVLLYSSFGNGTEGKAYVETSQLDGETNLKQRTALSCSQRICYNEIELRHFSASIQCDRPNKNLYSFNGTISIYDSISGLASDYPILYENLLLRGTRLKNTSYVYGAVIYTGHHTKLMMNNTTPPYKRSKIEFMMNLLVITVFSIQLALSLICAGISILYDDSLVKGHIWYLSGLYKPYNFRLKGFYQGVVVFFLLFNNFVPIGLLASLEFIKLALSRIFINNDKEMVGSDGIHAHANTTSMPEELGQIKMIFSDKTGTLTKNKMTFKKFFLPGTETVYGTSHAAPIDPAGIIAFSDDRVDNMKWKLEKNCLEFFNLFLSLALCQTILPEMKNDELVYQASSPDELTLVTFAKYMGFEFVARTETSMTIKYTDEATKDSHHITFELLNTLHFNSYRKRMSVIVRVTEMFLDEKFAAMQSNVGQIIIFSKGADDVMLKRVKPMTNLTSVNKALHEFSVEGLRTLVCAKKELSEDEYNKWYNESYSPASLSLQDRQTKLDQAAELIEREMELIGVTAIDDELQDNVAHTIEQLRKAGIKFFMLTGDKQETAVTIAHSCSLLERDMVLIELAVNENNVRDAFTLLDKKILRAIKKVKQIKEANNNTVATALVVNGQTLDILFDKTVRKKTKTYINFMRLCMYCKSVICARSSPSQKSKIVELAKKYVPNNRTLAIGDGANDVPMIQSAHVGVGISGKEGMQASRNADFSISEFRFLERLLLIHGRNNYRRVAKFILQTTYKNIANQSVQFYFAFFSLFGGRSLQLSVSLVLFNLLFTLFPMVCHALFDQEVSQKKNLAFPELYREGQRDYYLNLRVIITWILNAFYQGAVCFFIPLAMFYKGGIIDQYGQPNDFYGFSTIISTSILIVVTFKVLLETYTLNIISIIAIGMTMPLWFSFLVIYNIVPQSKEFYWAFFMCGRTATFWLTVFLSATVALMWDFCAKALVRIFPHTRRLYHCVQEIPEHLDVATMRQIASKEFDLKNYH